jgi:hypothetical protein
MVDRNKTINLLLPTYRRTAFLDKTLASIEETTGDKSSIFLCMYIDDDDSETLAYIASFKIKRFSYRILTFVAHKTQSMGAMISYLYKNSPRADIYMAIVDDYVFGTRGWDSLVYEAFSLHSDGLMMAFPQDPTSPGNVTFVILGSKWIDTLGRFLTDYFPFWYDDSWIDEVAQMVQRKIPVPIEMEPIGGKGKTPRMFNLWFWHQFFVNTIDERQRDADIIRKSIFTDDVDAYQINKLNGDQLAHQLEARQSRVTANECLLTELQLSSHRTKKEICADIKYVKKELNAVIHLCEKALIAVETNQNVVNERIFKNILSSSLCSPAIDRIAALPSLNDKIEVSVHISNLIKELRETSDGIELRSITVVDNLKIPRYPPRVMIKYWLLSLMTLPIMKEIVAKLRGFRTIVNKDESSKTSRDDLS